MRCSRCLPALLAGLSLLWLGATPLPTNNPAAPSRRPGAPPTTPAQGADRLSQELNLTEDQKARVQGVFEEMRLKVQTAILDARTNAEKELHQILTPDQYKKLQTMLQEGAHAQPGPESNAPRR